MKRHNFQSVIAHCIYQTIKDAYKLESHFKTEFAVGHHDVCNWLVEQDSMGRVYVSTNSALLTHIKDCTCTFMNARNVNVYTLMKRFAVMMDNEDTYIDGCPYSFSVGPVNVTSNFVYCAGKKLSLHYFKCHAKY